MKQTNTIILMFLGFLFILYITGKVFVVTHPQQQIEAKKEGAQMIPPMDFLRVTERKIVDSKQAEFDIKGIGLTNGVYMLTDSSKLMGSKYRLIQDDYDQMAKDGFNTVRLYMQYYWYDKLNPQNLFSYLDEQIAFAKKAKLYVILNLHFFGDSIEVEKHQQDGFFKGNAKYDVVAFWAAISNHYKAESTVLGYDLINEPTCCGGYSEEKLYDLYKLIITKIRNNDDKHIIIIADPINKYAAPKQTYFVQHTPYIKLDDPNIAYTYHWYQPIAFTHQGMFNSNYFEEGATYPLTISEADYRTGYYSNPYWNQSGHENWTEYIGNWVDFAALIAGRNDFSGKPMFNVSLSGSKIKGQVWYDDIVIEEKDVKSGKIKQLPVPNAAFTTPKDFEGWTTSPVPSSLPARWYPLSNPESTGVRFAWDMTENHSGTGSGALLIDGRKAVWKGSNPWANWSQSGGALSTYYNISPQKLYRVRAWVKIKDNSDYNVSIGFGVHDVHQIVYNLKTIKKQIDKYYSDWSKRNNVPLICTEFGVANPSRSPLTGVKKSDVQKSWLADMLKVFDSNGHGWVVHCYKSYAGRGDLFGLYDLSPSQDRDLIDVLKQPN